LNAVVTRDDLRPQLALSVSARHRRGHLFICQGFAAMKARIFVTLKNGVLDPQGKAIHHGLESLGFAGVNDVRMGKMIELDVDASVSDEVIEDMCRQLLANTVIENFKIVRD
jgi:phosphoribosylformylglycinamidine synthase subunit PurS